MKKIINGKVYDTDTAERIGNWDNGRPWGDFGHCTETLYKKRTGEFFLYGEGGPLSRYAVSHGDNEWSGGEKIIPLTYKSAQEWAENNLSGDEYESIFGEIVEDGEHTTVTLSLSTSTIERAKRAASERGMGLSAYVEKVLNEA